MKAFSIFGSIRSLQELNPNIQQRHLQNDWEPCYKQEGHQLCNEVIECIDQKVIGKISYTKQKAFAEVFTQQTFCKGSYILKEGQNISQLYLVQEGECIISKNEWIGEEFKILEDMPIPYSVIATKNMKVFCLSKEEFNSKVPKDLMPYFEKMAQNKCKWLQKRFYDIQKNINGLKDNYFESLNEQSNEIQKSFPQAASNALQTIRSKHIAHQDIQTLKQQSKEKEEKLNFALETDKDHLKSFKIAQTQHKVYHPQQSLQKRNPQSFSQIDLIALQSILKGPIRAGTQLYSINLEPIKKGDFQLSPLKQQAKCKSPNIQTKDISQLLQNDSTENNNQLQGSTFYESSLKNQSPIKEEFFYKRKTNQLYSPIMKCPESTQKRISLFQEIKTRNKQSHSASFLGLNEQIDDPDLDMDKKLLTAKPIKLNFLSQNISYLQDNDNFQKPQMIQNQFSPLPLPVNTQSPKQSQNNFYQKHLLLFCDTPQSKNQNSKDTTFAQTTKGNVNPMRSMSTAFMFNVNKNQHLIAKRNPKFEIINKKIKPQNILQMKESLKQQRSDENLRILQDDIQKMNEKFYVGSKKIQLIMHGSNTTTKESEYRQINTKNQQKKQLL